MSPFTEGIIIYERGGKRYGRCTGGQRKCGLEGCPGYRVGVRWSNGKITWPCGKGIGQKKIRGKLQFIIL